MRRLRYWGLRLLLAVGSVYLTLWALEAIALRTLQAPFVIYPSQRNCLRRSRQLSLKFRRNCTGFWAETHFHTNEIGLRGNSVRNDGSRRVLSIGDSCTWGWQTADDESYPAVLETVLNQRSQPNRYQVLNAGVPGYTSLQGMRYLSNSGLALRPAVVIVGFGFNDPTPDGDVAALIDRQARLMPLLLVDDYFTDISHFYRWLRWKAFKVEQSNAVSSNEPRVNPAAFRENLTKIVEVARAAGASVILLSFIEASAGDYSPALHDLAARMDVPLIVYEGQRLDLVHPTVDGYRRLVNAIAEHVDN